jgi:hypothetical protein
LVHGRLNSFVEPPLIPLNLPKEIRLDFLKDGQTLEQMFAAGELDALLSLYIPAVSSGLAVDRAAVPELQGGRAGLLSPHRIFPIMHTVVLRQDVTASTPGRRAASTRRSCRRATSRSRALRH